MVTSTFKNKMKEEMEAMHDAKTELADLLSTEQGMAYCMEFLVNKIELLEKEIEDLIKKVK